MSSEVDKESSHNRQGSWKENERAELESLLRTGEISPDNIKKFFAKHTSSEFYSGPIMHPALLKQLEEIVSGGANRVIELTEREQLHRQKQEDKIIETKIWQVKASLRFGVFCFLTLLVLIIVADFFKLSLAVYALAGIGIIGVVSQIINLGRSGHKETN